MKIEVTQEDIERGEAGWCASCPIALAMKRAGFESPYVEDKTVDFTVRNRVKGAELPESAQEFIVNFDNGFSVKPFSFELDI